MIYISGAITGTTDFIERFLIVEQHLINNLGYAKTFNPSQFSMIEGLEHWQYMELCLVALKWCDSIYMMPGWEESKGAKMEYEFAKANGINVILGKYTCDGRCGFGEETCNIFCKYSNKCIAEGSNCDGRV